MIEVEIKKIKEKVFNQNKKMNSSNSKLKPIFLLILFVLNVLPIHAQGFDHSCWRTSH